MNGKQKYTKFLALKQKYRPRNGRPKITLKGRHLHRSTYDSDLDFKCLFKCFTKHFKHQEPLFAFFTFVFVLVFVVLLTQDYVIDISCDLCAKVVFSFTTMLL